MARAGARAGKVFSSGRLSVPVRAAPCKRRAAVRKTSTTSVDSGYSLCSSDSEDQVLDINRGLDRCAALLHDILQCDVKERPLQPHNTKGNVRPSTVRAKKTAVRRPPPAPHVYKERGPLRRTFPPDLCNAEGARPPVNSPPLIAPSQNLDHLATQMQRLNHMSAPAPYSAPPAPGPESSALYNCRLPTSTPTLSPQRPADPQSLGNEGFYQTLPPGGASHPPSGRPASSSALSMAGSVQAAALHNSSAPSGHQASVVSQMDGYRSLIRDSDLLQCMAAHLAQLQHADVPLQNPAAADTAEPPTDEDDAVAPLREVSCQTSFNKVKTPEKTGKKIKTVKYLLEEIKSLVTDQGDREAMRLVAELEHSVSLLPMAAGSANIHAEIALALQPLKSENAQLRRRLRIVNQQLRDRERSARTDEETSEVTSLQSMNETLQRQLSETQRGLERLQSVTGAQEEENRRTSQSLQEREREILQLQQQREDTAAAMKREVDEAVGKMKSVQFRLEASEKENQILGITLRQRDAEVSRLRELTRTLQAGMAKLLCDLGKDAPKPGSSLTQAALGSHERQVASERCPASTSIMNYLRRLETDQVLTGTDSLYSETPLLPTADCMGSKSQVLDDGPPEPPYSPHRDKQGLGSELCYVTSEEHRPDETLYLPLASSPCGGRRDPSRMCTPPKVCAAETEHDFRSRQDNHHGLHGSDQHHKDSPNTPRMSDLTPRAHPQDPNLEGPPPRVPVLQQMRSLGVRDDPPSDRSVFEGRPDWTICSFSTFTSHDEQDFRNGLAALDANIAKLQRSLQSGAARR